MKPQLAVVLLMAPLAFSQQKPQHPDLSGTWTFGIDLPPGDLVRSWIGKVTRDPLGWKHTPPRERNSGRSAVGQSSFL